LFNHSYFVVAILGSWHWENQFLFVFYTFAIGFFPIIFIYLANYHVRKATLQQQEISTKDTIHNRNQTVANNEYEPPQLLTLTGDNKSDNLQVLVSQILYIKSADNYCEITIIKDNQICHKLLRSSLTSILKQIPEKTLVYRCHRSYAVNLALVELSKGNAAGLQLILKPMGITVPVSRSYVDTIKQALLLVPEAC
jgi:DNA-binding LytR/AlgR family response regulator